MQFQFLDAIPSPAPRLVVRLVNQDAIPADLEPVLAEAAKASRFAGKPGQTFEGFVERSGALARVALAGTGKADASDRTRALEKAGGALAAKYLTAGESELLLDLTGSGLSAPDVAAVLLGLRLRSFRLDTYRTKLPEERKPTLEKVSVIGAPEGTGDAWAEADALAQGVAFTKELVTEPANAIFPDSFVERCRGRMIGTGITLRCLDEREMQQLGMGALLGVAQGSALRPRLLVMEWNGGSAGEKPIAFVGKGVTFDSGGISLKPGPGMEDMKWDMGGAGAVAGTMLALALRKAKANVVGVCGLVENMPDGNAQRPGDVVTSMSGQTIEILNTDAEGRLVLCDALTYVQREFAPTTIVNLATLTGAIIVSLGHEHAGMFSNNDGLASRLDAAGKASGDMLWRLPLGPAYDKLLESPIADMKNVGPRYAGSITAAQFLKRFIENDTPWAHLDIAGTVWTDKPGPTWDKGASGFGVRLLDRLVRENFES